MKLLTPTAGIIFLLFAVLACNNRLGGEKSKPSNVSELRLEETDKTDPGQSDNIADTAQTPPQEQKFQRQDKTIPESKGNWDKKIIKNASVTLEVKNYRSFNEIVRENVKKIGGYVAQEEQNQTDYKMQNTIAVKVPVDQFDDLLNVLTGVDEKLIDKKITSEDVTTEMVDTKSRMEAKKQVRLKYLDLLKQAKNMEEILNVQNEINDVQEEIEAAAGRIAYLTHSSAYSTINLTYFQVLDASAKNRGEVSYRARVWQSFNNGWNWIGDVFVGLLSVWPLFFLVVSGWFAYRKWLSHGTQKRNA